MEDYKIERRNNKLIAIILNYEWTNLEEELPAEIFDKIKSLIKKELIEANVKKSNNSKFFDIYNKWQKIRTAIEIKMSIEKIDNSVLENILYSLEENIKINKQRFGDTKIFINTLINYDEDKEEMDVEFFYKDDFVLRVKHTPLMGGQDTIETDTIDIKLLTRLLMELRGIKDNYYGNIRIEDKNDSVTFLSEEEKCATINNEGLKIINEKALANLFVVIGSYNTKSKKKENKKQNTIQKNSNSL